MEFHELLKKARSENATDLHLTSGKAPVIRVNRLLKQLELPVLEPEGLKGFVKTVVSPEQWNHLKINGEIDLAYAVPGLGRFRMNIFRQKDSYAMAVRMIPLEVPTFDKLLLPLVLKELVDKKNGLLIAVGPAGSGKSTTLAALVDYLNQFHRCHIITLEDPIEYVHEHGQSIVNQREVGTDTVSFTSGLRSSLREDPDVILLGEMRDLETVTMAIRAAETGHLVLTTLHTPDAPQTVNRIIDMFPAEQQRQIQVQLADTLQGVVAQRLLPRADGQGLIAAVEVMIATTAVRNLIREGKVHQILSTIQTGRRYGMQTMEQALQELYSRGLVKEETIGTGQ